MLMMDWRKLFNHDVYFDYTDRMMQDERFYGCEQGMASILTDFSNTMWNAYRDKFPTTYDTKYNKFYFTSEK